MILVLVACSKYETGELQDNLSHEAPSTLKVLKQPANICVRYPYVGMFLL